MTLTSRTFEVLAAFTPEHRTRRLAELAATSGLPLTTTHRIVADLVRCGALERAPDGSLHVGLRLWEIGSLAPRGNALRDVALPFLEDLYVATRENVQLAVREGLESVFVERLTGREAVTVMTRVGTRFPLTSTGVGRALLAHAPADVQEAALARPVRRWTPFTEVDPARLRAGLAEVRRTGVAVSDREVTRDAVSVAAPVRGPGGDVVAAVSLVVRHGTVSPPALGPAVRAAALGISRALGAPPSAVRKSLWREEPAPADAAQDRDPPAPSPRPGGPP
ncbi:IclR family transcriptional regulator [Kineococcus sp. LSe6-4]|uniref:IclR family transcriptional regulator n=1 Tax=Kineococcus halophytocola TaxID=3234027 RepID=A0ABV4H351_9ACTN